MAAATRVCEGMAACFATCRETFPDSAGGIISGISSSRACVFRSSRSQPCSLYSFDGAFSLTTDKKRKDNEKKKKKKLGLKCMLENVADLEGSKLRAAMGDPAAVAREAATSSSSSSGTSASNAAVIGGFENDGRPSLSQEFSLADGSAASIAGVLNDGDVEKRRSEIRSAIAESFSNCLTATCLDETVPGLTSKKEGKVRDTYDAGELLVIVTTDRQSAFDRLLASVPFKGQVLNQTSGWWFDNTKHIVPNAALCRPDPNVTIFKKCSVFPIEFVVRGYITGTTNTSLWTLYSAGERNYCGNVLREGLLKNEKLEKNILTPTTKAHDHDVPISPEEIVKTGLMTKDDFEYVQNKALALFAYGQEVALKNGLLLVDTKYEFGRASDGTIMLIDEIHTPDSSRYWISKSYAERHAARMEPESIDKEFLRLWFKNNCNPYSDAVLPDAPKELVAELSSRYIMLYETITGTSFTLPDLKESAHDRMSRNVNSALSSRQIG